MSLWHTILYPFPPSFTSSAPHFIDPSFSVPHLALSQCITPIHLAVFYLLFFPKPHFLVSSRHTIILSLPCQLFMFLVENSMSRYSGNPGNARPPIFSTIQLPSSPLKFLPLSRFLTTSTVKAISSLFSKHIHPSIFKSNPPLIHLTKKKVT